MNSEDGTRATFGCSLCGKQAGSVYLRGAATEAEVQRESFTGLLTQQVPARAFDDIRAALAAGDVARPFALEPEYAPFYCPPCNASYCADHWDRWTSSTTRCPIGTTRSGAAAPGATSECSMTDFPHLPPGREPGAQSLRSRTGWPFWEWAMGLVGSGMVVGGIFLAAGGRGPEFDRGEGGPGRCHLRGLRALLRADGLLAAAQAQAAPSP